MKKIRLSIVRFAPLLLILAFAATQYILIFRHKSPYLSDSYFYKHIFYQMKGDSYDVARAIVVSQVDLTGADDININFFTNDRAYKNSLSFFTKRPFYPFLASFVSIFTSNEFLAFATPVFFAYMASVVLSFYFFRRGLNYFFAVFSLALFISFHPFLDWSTYFLTDTIGFAFWFLILFYIYRYIRNGTKKLLLFFLGILSISLFNREQSLLILPLLLTFWSALKIVGYSKKVSERTLRLILVAGVITGLYLLLMQLTRQRTYLDALVYTQNSYGLFQKEYTFSQTLAYITDSVIRSHFAFVGDLTRYHWWFVFFVLGIIGALRTLFFDTKKRLIDLLLFSSGIASYISIFLYPVLSYRFFYPVVVMMIYFSSKLIQDFFLDLNKHGLK